MHLRIAAAALLALLLQPNVNCQITRLYSFVFVLVYLRVECKVRFQPTLVNIYVTHY